MITRARTLRRIFPFATLLGTTVAGTVLFGGCVGDDPQGGGGGDGGGGDATTGSDSGPGSDGGGGDAACSNVTCGSKTCVDLQSDPDNCGACNVVCQNTGGTNHFACVSGKCGNKVVQVTAGVKVSCALLSEGSVWCWGRQDVGQTGQVSATTTPVPQKVAGMTNAVEVYAGDSTVCARDNSGDVYCWGDNSAGTTGQAIGGDPSCSGTCNPTPKKVALPEKAAQLTGALQTMCVRTVPGNVYCWGINSSNILGKGTDTQATSPTPVKVPVFAGDVIDLDMGYANNGNPGLHALACAVRSDKTLWCWGSNTAQYEELGHAPGGGTPADVLCTNTTADYDCNSTPQPILEVDGGAVANVSEVRTRNKGGCLLRLDNTVWCWGANAQGELGNGSSGAGVHPNPLQIATNGSHLAQADLTGFYLDTGGQVHGWGLTYSGLFGTDYTPEVDAPIVIPNLSDVKQVSVRSAYGLALKNDGTIVAWGVNIDGVLGHATGSNGDSLCEPNDAGECHPVVGPLLNAPWQ